jgi:multidrug efflux system membrane fusion protein
VRGKGAGRLEIRAYRPDDSNASVGKLTFIDNAVDATTGTIKLMGTFANGDRRLWPGEFVNVRLVLGMEPHATVVPATAVQTGQQGKYVLVVQPDNTAVMRPVSSSRSYRQLAVIDNGLQPGERVIVEGQIRVVPNNKVQVVKTVPVEPAPEQLAQQSGTTDMSGGRP